MNLIDLKYVRRCDKCCHLIPEDAQECPYCQGSVSIDRQARMLPEEPVEEVPREPMSEETKKKLKIAGVAAVALIVLALGVNYVMGLYRLDKPITEPLTAEEISSETEKEPEFAAMYQQIEGMRSQIQDTEEKNTFGKITYKQMIDFLKLYSSTEYCNKIYQKADEEYEEVHHKPALVKVEETKKKWKDFVENHTPENFINITVGNRYEQSGYYYYPGFFFKVTFPKGEIQDCRVHYGLYNKSGEYYHYNAEADGDLQALLERSETNGYRWNNAYSYSQDIFDSWETRCEIRSVTRSDGTVIQKSDLDEVPATVQEYLDNATPETEFALIRDQIDKSYPSKDKVRSDFVLKKLSSEDELCCKLAELTNNAKGTELVHRGWKFVSE